MAYNISTKDGIVIEGIPDDVSPDDPSLKQRVTRARTQKTLRDEELRQADPTSGLRLRLPFTDIEVGGQGVGEFAAGAGKALTDATRGAGQLMGLVSREDVAEARERDAALMDTGAGFAGDIVGNIAMALAPGGALKGAAVAARGLGAARAAPALSAAGGALLVPKSITGAGAVGAGMGALQPSVSTEETLRNVALGTGVSAALPAAARVIRPETRAGVKTLMDAGITPTPGQILGGWAQRLEDKARSLPITGDFITNAQRKGVEDLNRAAYSRALSPIGVKAPKAVGREGVEDVYNQLTAAYDNLLPKLQFKADKTFAQEVAAVRQMASELPEEQAKRFEQILRNGVFRKLTPQGNASGETIKEIESSIGRLARGYGKDQSHDIRQLGDALDEVQAIVRRNLERTNPKQAKELADINRGYSAYARIRDAASRPGELGVFSPAQLAQAVRKGDSSVGKGAYARGAAPMQDLSDAAVSVLGPKYPDSGTAGRLLAGGAGLGAGFINPAIPAALAAGGVPYLPIVREAMAAMLTKRPEVATEIARVARKAIPLGVVGSSSLPASINANQQ